ncbi:MAG TPA: sigma-54 dependent transcriptional regulator [Chitinophagaceae bacterium]|nr:sigma-54-dependent Fis family transcriptional regulator [Cytophagales bacterium]HNF72675.1 sigma-54 dependent transcriptional regulator [Chitinophagaceae bacterium]
MKKKEFTNINVLVVDDSPESVELIKRNLQSKGYQIYTASNVQSGIKVLGSVSIDLLITDLKMPGESGIELVRHASENHKGIGILVVTGFPSIQGAVESIKIGAEEYLVKSFTDEELFTAVERVLTKTKKTKIDIPSVQNFGIIGESDGMKKIFTTIRKAKSTNATVLIYGESGTGKELVARALHYGGNASAAPFVPVNCGGIPDTLLESELFGYVKGAFTGATETRAGFFQTADGGTIFLDEISNTSLAMQAKLLRVLQEKEFYMVGSKKTLKVNVRIVAATNVDLMQLVKKGLFREDLYYRLNIITIDLPPLRERGDDILQLIYFFLGKYVKELGKSSMKFTPKALQALKDYSWPGNVRELQNLIHRLVIMSEDSTIDIPDLPESFRFSGRRSKGLDRKLEDVEREYILDALAANKNNISQTAISLGIDRKTLRDKLKKYTPIN